MFRTGSQQQKRAHGGRRNTLITGWVESPSFHRPDKPPTLPALHFCARCVAADCKSKLVRLPLQKRGFQMFSCFHALVLSLFFSFSYSPSPLCLSLSCSVLLVARFQVLGIFNHNLVSWIGSVFQYIVFLSVCEIFIWM